MTVKELVDVMDMRIMFEIFEAGNNRLLFDSSDWNNTLGMRKSWDYLQNRNVVQLSNDGNGEQASIYIEVEANKTE